MFLLILYATQTGNSEYICRIIEQERNKHGDDSLILSLDEFNIDKINQFEKIIFVVSTHGEGDPPFNAAEFYDKLKNIKYILTNSKTDTNIFNFEYFILGLGSTSYKYYNQFAKSLDRLLGALGAKRGDVVLADDNDSEGFYTELNQFIKILDSHLKADEKFIKNKAIINNCKKEIKYLKATVISNKQIVSGKYKINRVILDIPAYDNFISGDCIGITPSKDYEHLSIPHWGIFKYLYSVCDQDDLYKNKLKDIADDYNEYYSYVKESNKNIKEILDDFKMKHLEINEEMKMHLNKIRTRWYTTSRNQQNGYYVIDYNVDNKKGLCVNYLLKIKENDQIDVKIGKSMLYFDQRKILIFCTGTGLSLAKAIIDENLNREILVYYGHRDHNDCLLTDNYKTRSNVVIKCVRSRIEGKYIQDRFKEDNVNVDEYMIYLCGSVRMSRSIRKILKGKVIQSETW